MSDIVRIMPKEPIEAVPTEWANMFGGYDTMYRTESGVGVFDDDYAEYCDGHDWVEVTEYVWDGTDEAFAVIHHALGEIGLTVEADGDNDMTWHILVIRGGGDPGWTGRELGNVSLHARIRIEGDTFSIHPPTQGR